MKYYTENLPGKCHDTMSLEFGISLTSGLIKAAF